MLTEAEIMMRYDQARRALWNPPKAIATRLKPREVRHRVTRLSVRSVVEVPTFAAGWSGAIKGIPASKGLIRGQKYTMGVLMHRACKFHGVSKADIIGERRNKEYVAARRDFIGMAYEFTSKSLPEIGRFCNRDHTTILHHARKLGLRR